MKMNRSNASVFKVVILAATLGAATGCEQQEFRMPPYIVKEGCTFTLVIGSDKEVSATVPENRNRVTEKLSIGKYAIGISGCEVVDNPNGLAIYED